MAAPLGKFDFDKIVKDLGIVIEPDDQKFRMAMGYFGSGFGKAPNAEEVAALAAARLNRGSLPTTRLGTPIVMEKVVDGKTMRLVSCGNHHDPRDEDFAMYERGMSDEHHVDLTCPDPVQRTRQWLDKMVQADPLPNEHYTTQGLKDIGMVGLYLWVDVPEDEQVQPTLVVS